MSKSNLKKNYPLKMNGFGSNKTSIFIFVHGYGSSPKDLMPLSLSLNSKGFTCVNILLDGHYKKGRSLIGYNYNNWKTQVINTILPLRKKYKKIYLIGFSIGASICIDIAKENKDIAGVIGFSTFILPSKPIQKYFLIFLKRLGIKFTPRLIQVTEKKSKNEIYYSKTVPIVETEELIKDWFAPLLIGQLKNKIQIYQK